MRYLMPHIVTGWRDDRHPRYAADHAMRMREVEGHTLLGLGREHAVGGAASGEGPGPLLERHEAEARLPLLIVLTGG
jgi:hypothetical protein